MLNSFVEKFKDKKIWLAWRWKKTQTGLTKVPYQINGEYGSSTNSETWNTYSQIQPYVTSARFDGVGVVFETEQGIIGVDFDHCVADGVIEDSRIANFIKDARTYCEYSPSGTGLHLLFHAKKSFSLSPNKRPAKKIESPLVEIYVNGRYFTFTGKEHSDSVATRTINEDDFIALLKTIGYPWEEGEVTKPDKSSPSFSITDSEVLKKMFGAKNGSSIQRLYDGDISGYGDDESSADLALCMHLAFWTGKNYSSILSLWLSSPLGKRKKTQERSDYQNRTVSKAIEYTSDVYTPFSASSDVESDEYVMSTGKNPAPLLILENICRVLEKDSVLSGKFRLNTFSHITETSWDRQEWVNLYDGCILEVQRFVSSNYPFFRKLSRQMLTDAILATAYRNKVNPPRDYFASLVWDHTPRLNSWLHNVYGVPDDTLHQAIGSNWIKGIIKRVMRPGSIFDEVLALESRQGWRKSTSIRELGAPWHVETTHSMDDKDFHLIVAQNVIVEFSEGDVFARSSMAAIKSEITKTEDQFRPPYERGILTFKRSCVFAVTTNNLALKDDTGNRRWLPVVLEKIADVDWIKENRDQLYAEAYYRVVIQGESTHEYPIELEDLQASRREYSDQDETVVIWYSSLSEETKADGVTLKEACSVAYPKSDQPTRLDELRIASILRGTLHLESRLKKVNGIVIRRWMPTEKTISMLKDVPAPLPFLS